MNFKFLKVALASLMLSISTSSYAGLISVSDWHLTTDNLGGLRQSTHIDEMYFALTQSFTYNPQDDFEMIAGYHWASEAEVINLYDNATYNNVYEYKYYKQGGWSGYIKNGNGSSFALITSDTNITNNYLHVGNGDHISLHNNPTAYNRIAGWVLIKEPVAVSVSVPEPSTLAIFALGLIALTSRKLSKYC